MYADGATSMTRCLDCKLFSFQRAPEAWKRSGKGPCERHEAFTLFDPMSKRDCDHFTEAGNMVIAKRERFLAQLFISV